MTNVGIKRLLIAAGVVFISMGVLIGVFLPFIIQYVTPHTKFSLVRSYEGNGNQITAGVAVSDTWRLVWGCKPGFGELSEYPIDIAIVNKDGTPYDMSAVRSLCAEGQTGGTLVEYGSSTVYFIINSSGYWKLSIQGT